MSLSSAAACAALLTAFLAGCQDVKLPAWPWSGKQEASSEGGAAGKQASGADAAAPAADSDPKEREIRRLRLKIQDLEADKELLGSQVEHLKHRDQLAADYIRKLNFANHQLQDQLKTLADAPIQRDKLQTKLEALTLILNRLEEDNAALRRRIEQLTGRPVPTTRPAVPAALRSTSRPASRPATRPAG